jgi:hypothetical protein
MELVIASWAVWVSVPEVPVNVMLAVVVGAEAAAEMVICSGVPGVREMDEGEMVTPVGKPLTCTVTADEKPFEPVAESEAVPDWPS